ncbi:MAG TPA: DNA polymerase III subunit delta [Aquificaceae bacterium]|nr:DNA polymerase III subunit delta [Aquificaceae bacterium]HIQ48210.1 DNA polymerase III subunit delta [Aquifex aeolicus]
MEKTIIQFQKEFFVKPPQKRVFLIHGDEPYLIKNFLSKLKEKYRENYKVLWGDDITEEEFYTNISETNIFGNLKENAVVLYNFEDFLKKLGRKKKAKELLIKTLKNIKSNYLFIVFDRKLQKQELSTEPYKSIQSFGMVIVAGRLSKEKIRQLVLKKFREKGVKIEEKAIDYLLELTEHNLMELKLEVEKLIDYAFETKDLSLEEVKSIAFAISENANLFEFIDAFLMGEGEKAVKLLDTLYRWGFHPLQIQKILVSYVIKLYIAQRLLQKGKDLNTVLESLGIKNNYAKLKFKNYIQRNKTDRLERMLSFLQRIDMFEKIYFQNPEDMFKDFVVSFALAPAKG